MSEKILEKRAIKLNPNEFLYSLSLQLRFHWLQERSNKLDETVARIVVPINGAKRLFNKLIRRFKYVDRLHSQTNLEKIANQINNVWGCCTQTTLIMPVCSKRHKSPDGSYKMIYDLRNALGVWNGELIRSFFDLEDPHLRSGFDVILCDDFIGSGTTIEQKMSILRDTMTPEAKLYVVSLAAMKKARDRVLTRPEISFYTPLLLDQGINDSKDESIMRNMEALLAPTYNNQKMEKCSLGYAKTGSLYYNEDYRIPNNVYPVFWWGEMADGEAFNSLFRRP